MGVVDDPFPSRLQEESDGYEFGIMEVANLGLVLKGRLMDESGSAEHTGEAPFRRGDPSDRDSKHDLVDGVWCDEGDLIPGLSKGSALPGQDADVLCRVYGRDMRDTDLSPIHTASLASSKKWMSIGAWDRFPLTVGAAGALKVAGDHPGGSSATPETTWVKRLTLLWPISGQAAPRAGDDAEPTSTPPSTRDTKRCRRRQDRGRPL